MSSNEVTQMALAKTQAKRVRREASILIQMIARIEENNPAVDLQPEEAQGNDQSN